MTSSPGRLDQLKAFRVPFGVWQQTSKTGSATADPGITKRLADAILRDDCFAVGEGNWLYVYQSGVYISEGEKVVSRRVKELLNDWGKVPEWSSFRAAEVAKYIQTDAPRLWDRPTTMFINVLNGLLEVLTGKLHPHSPAYLSSVQLPVIFDPAATCEEVDRFIGAVLPADTQNLVYELAAWLMRPDMSIQKAILLLGEGANGKSTLLAMLMAFLGRNNVSNLSLQTLEKDRFAAAGLVGKLANICADLPSADLTSSSMFKAVVGGDSIRAEYKFRDGFSFTPFARFIYSANTPPRSPDASHAFFRRWEVVPFNRTFEGGNAIPRPVLDALLADPKQLSGVLNRALAALPQLMKSGITQTPSMKAAWEEFRQTTDPLAVWLDRETIEGTDAVVPTRDLLQAYQRACVAAGRPALTNTAFGQSLRRLRPGVSMKQRMVASRLVWCYIGIGLSTPGGPSPVPSTSQSSHGSQTSPTCTLSRAEDENEENEEVDNQESVSIRYKYGNPVNRVNSVNGNGSILDREGALTSAISNLINDDDPPMVIFAPAAGEVM